MALDRVNNSTPVLLMCCGTPVGALGALRSLGRWDVPVYAIDSERHGRVWSSRYCRECFYWEPLNSPLEESLESLLAVGRRLGRALLVPTFDEGAIFAASHYDVLREYFIYPRQSAEVVRSLVNKKEMYFVARRHGLSVPESSWPQSRREVSEFAERARFPIALKAIRGVHLKLKAGVTAFIVRSARELLGLYDRYEDATAPNLMLQEYIPGADSCGWGFNGYFDERSECVIGGTTRRLHQYPVHVGITSLSVIQDNDEVSQASRSFMSAVGYRGLVNLGFRYDAHDGKYKLVDVNPRLGASFRSFVTKDGCDILRAFYLDLTKQKVTPCGSYVSRKWLLESDVSSCIAYRREGQPMRKLLAEYRGVKELAYLCLDDPLPFGFMCLTAISRPLKRAWRFFVPGSVPPSKEHSVSM